MTYCLDCCQKRPTNAQGFCDACQADTDERAIPADPPPVVRNANEALTKPPRPWRCKTVGRERARADATEAELVAMIEEQLKTAWWQENLGYAGGDHDE
jgi:hypothetical protein